LGSFDTRLYLDVNNFAERTAWAHGVLRAYYSWAGLLLLALVGVIALWRARGGLYGGGVTDRVADVLWAGLASLLAVLVAQPVAHLVGRARPYRAITQPVEVLVARSGGFGLPSGRAALAGALVLGVLLARDRLMGAIAVLAGLLFVLAGVYVGVSYPGDVLAGVLLGVLVAAVLRPPALGLLRTFTDWAAGVTGLRFLVGVASPSSVVMPAPAVRVPGHSGAVRILESGARPVPQVSETSRLVARAAKPARPHVETSRSGGQGAAGGTAVREARDSGRRGAAGSAGDL
jgi:membrane-associated phospholipid phosphatase